MKLKKWILKALVILALAMPSLSAHALDVNGSLNIVNGSGGANFHLYSDNKITSKFSILGTNGNTLSTGTLGISGDTTLGANVSVHDKLFLDGSLAGNDYWFNSANGQNDLYSNGILALRTDNQGRVTFPTLPLGVSSGGTGLQTISNHAILIGAGTNPPSQISGGTGTVVRGVTGADPTFGAVVLTTDVTGTLPVSHGGTGVTTSTGTTNVVLSDSATMSNSFLTGTLAITAQIATDINPAGSGLINIGNFSNLWNEIFVARVDPPSQNALNANSGVKAWGNVNSDGSTNTTYNSSVSKVGLGLYNVTFSTDFFNTSYVVNVTTEGSVAGTSIAPSYVIVSAHQFQVFMEKSNGTGQDIGFSYSAFGRQ